METATQHPFESYRDKLGRNILDKKITFYFINGEIVLRGAIKKAVGTKELNNYREEFIALDMGEVPNGWHSRKDFDFFYTPTSINLFRILDAKTKDNKIIFSDSFAMFLVKKIKQAKEMEEGLNQVRGL